VQITKNSGAFPVWVRGGKELIYATLSGDALMSVRVEIKGGELDPGEPHLLLKLPRGCTGWDVARDGERILVSVPTGEARGAVLRVVLNWTGLLKQ
jgi:hypothetical protein